jgi:cytochrome bd ubiquinol oxidase subunit II
MKTEGALFAKLERLIQSAAVSFVVLFVLVTMVTLVFMTHVAEVFRNYPILFGLPVLVLLSVASTVRLVARRAFRWAFFNSALNLALLMGLVAASLFPTLLRNRIPGGRSLDIYFSASSAESLETMLIIAAIGGPLVLAYTGFVFYTFRGKVELDEHSY